MTVSTFLALAFKILPLVIAVLLAIPIVVYIVIPFGAWIIQKLLGE